MTASDATTLTPYDEVPYLSGARNASSIDRLATLGSLLGIPVASPGGCRVLELACGDGGNLLPMAVSFPGSEFVGVDLAPTAVARGMAGIASTGLENVRLLEGTFASAGPELGQFDYVIAHGVYSWVPEAARDELLRVIRERLTPYGVAFVSYNAQPGSHIRGILREMMLMHTRAITEPVSKVKQARALLTLLAHAPAEAGDVYRPLLLSEVGKAMQTSDFMLFHDDLAEINEPFFFSDFVAAAGRHGLQFAAEANFYQMSLEILEPEVAAQLAGLGQQDLIAKEQYLDFMTCRSFRQTLLCHQEVSLDRAVDMERVRLFRFSSAARRVEPAGEGGAIEFRCPNSSVLRTDNPATIAALEAMVACYPRSLSFESLADAAGVGSEDDADSLAEVLYRAFSAGVIEFRVSEPSVVFEVSERPLASPWARHRSATGHVVNLYHETIGLDQTASAVLALLDGTSTVSAIAAGLEMDEALVHTEVAGFAAKGLLVG